jgi:putative sterol carrier protein
MSAPAELLAQFVARFRPEAAEGLRAVYQLHVNGDHGGSWHLSIADRQCHLSPGPAPNPDVIITMSADDWRDLVAGRLDGAAAYLAGRLRITGDCSLVTRRQSLCNL